MQPLHRFFTSHCCCRYNEGGIKIPPSPRPLPASSLSPKPSGRCGVEPLCTKDFVAVVPARRVTLIAPSVRCLISRIAHYLASPPILRSRASPPCAAAWPRAAGLPLLPPAGEPEGAPASIHAMLLLATSLVLGQSVSSLAISARAAFISTFLGRGKQKCLHTGFEPCARLDNSDQP